MIPNYPQFKPIDLEMANSIAISLKNYSPTTCELCLGNLYIWAEVDSLEVTQINNNLCLFFNPKDEEPYFAEPIGNNKLTETFSICLQHCRRISRVSEKCLQSLPTSNEYIIKEMPEQFDYVYITNELAELKGKKYDAKRNHIHKFVNFYPNFKFCAITTNFGDNALTLFQKWTNLRPQKSRTELAILTQQKALTNSFKYFTKFGFIGGYIENEGEILGFILGSPLNDSTFAIHFQYGLDAPGIYQILLQQFCAQIQPDFPYVNLEQDLGLSGLRKMKSSYHPLRIEKKYEIS